MKRIIAISVGKQGVGAFLFCGCVMNEQDKNRFWMKVNKGGLNDCWLWLRTTTKQGYGIFWMGGKNYRAHRVSYELAYETIADGLNVCHSCDNPTCVNPAHLWAGSQKENVHDAIKKGRFVFTGTPIPDSSTNKIRALYEVLTTREIAKKYGTSFTTVLNFMNKHGIERRGTGRRQKSLV